METFLVDVRGAEPEPAAAADRARRPRLDARRARRLRRPRHARHAGAAVGEGPRGGRPHLLRAIAEGKPDAPDQILARWTWRLSRAVRKQLDRKASQEYPDAKRLLGALANSRGHRHEENAAKLVNAALEMPNEVGAALLASAEGYTPRATQLLEAARERLGTIQEVAGWIAESLPQPKTGPSARAPPAPAQEEADRGTGGRRCAGAGGARPTPGPSRHRRRRRRQASSRPRRRRRSAPAKRPADGRRSAEAVEPDAERPSSRVARRRRRVTNRSRRTRNERPTGTLVGSTTVLVLLGIGFLAGSSRRSRRACCPCCRSCSPAARRVASRSASSPGSSLSFSVFTLFAAWLLDKLGLPQDLLRNLAIVLLFVIAATLLVPRVGAAARAAARGLLAPPPAHVGGGFLLGVDARARLRAVRGPGARDDHRRRGQRTTSASRAILLTLAYALGAARADARDRARRPRGGGAARGDTPRRCASVSGVLIAAVALGARLPRRRQPRAAARPGYTTFLQNKVENNAAGEARAREGARWRRRRSPPCKTPAAGPARLRRRAAAHADGAWINSQPLTLAQLRGKVVLSTSGRTPASTACARCRT